VEKLFVSIQVILEERALELRGMIMVVSQGGSKQIWASLAVGVLRSLCVTVLKAS
jgi:hypothetical protein